MPRFPTIAEHATSVSHRVYSTLAERARSQNERVFALHVGDTYREPLLDARAERQLTSEHPRLHNYAQPHGEPVLLDAVRDYLESRHGIDVPLERLQIMSGATPGLSVICQVLLEPGDEVLLPSPFWPLIRGIIATKGAVPVQVPFMTRLDDTDFDAEAILEAAVTERTVALYINTPNNPTGRIVPGDVIDAMIRVAVRHDLWLLCDEAYEEIYFRDTPPKAVWRHRGAEDRAIACHTLSKSYGFAGARVGFAHGPEDVMHAVRGVQTFETYCAPRPMQFGGAHALREGAQWMRESRALYKAAGHKAAAALGLRPPEGSTFLFLDVGELLPPGASDCLPFLERCADQGLLLAPGRSCGADYARWVRLCYTTVPPADLEEALARLAPLVQRSSSS